jgi:predicted ATPase
MIISISIGNFKAFADVQTLPIKPITLIFGANSAGKSSIIHGLVFANEVFSKDENDLDIHFTKLGGDSVDLGGFGQFINNRDYRKNVIIGFGLDEKNYSDRLKEIFFVSKVINVIIEFGFYKTNSYRSSELNILSYEIQTDGVTFIKMSTKESGLSIDYINDKNILFENLLEVIVTSFTTSGSILNIDRKSFIEGLNKVIPEIRINVKNNIPTNLTELNKFKDPRKEPISPVNKENRDEILQNLTFNLIPYIINDIIFELSNYIEKSVENIEYLGPLRSYPERHFNFRKKNDNNWKAGGGYAWDVVLNDYQIREKVNSWLSSEKLKQKYEFRVINLIPINEIERILPGQLFFNYLELLSNIIIDTSTNQNDPTQLFSNITEEIENIILEKAEDYIDIDDLNNEDQVDALMQSNTLNVLVSENSDVERDTSSLIQNMLLLNEDKLLDLVLFDKNSNIQISHRDVGIGISQVLPVLVSVFANKNKLIAIEQPEIHLHPALQAELADLFINSALGENKNSFILETHSEHLILRILRRIRETTNNELKEGMIPVRPEDVQIVFVRPSDKGAEIVNLEITEDGDFKTKWPDGFFEERAEELF